MKTFNSSNYRTVAECLEIIKQLDPDTAITEFFIRKLCRESSKYPDLVIFPSGNKVLIQLISLFKTLHIDYEDESIKHKLNGD